MTTTDPTTSAAATRTVGGATVPATGTWAIDAAHSTVGFWVRHLGLSKVRGRFGTVEGVARIAEDPTASDVEVTIDVTSVDTRQPDRDAHLRSADFFDVESHPSLTFRSTSVRQAGEGWEIDGELTIRGTTRPVTLDVEFEGAGPDAWGGTRAAFTARTEIDRTEFGLTWNQAVETGSLVVSKKVTIEIDVQLVRQP